MATWCEGGFQTIQRGVVGLTTKRLDPLDMAMLAITDQGMDLSIGDPEVRALLVGTSEPLVVDAFGGSPSAFHLRPGTHRYRRWSSSRRESGAESTGGTIVWAAGLEETLEHDVLGPSS